MELSEIKQEDEFEKDFGDGGDGPCDHPQCCLERSIESSANAIMEGLAAMAFAEWPPSLDIVERLRALAEFLTDSLDDVETPEIGTAYPLPPKDESDGH